MIRSATSEPFDLSRPAWPPSSSSQQADAESSGRMRNLSASSEANSDLEVIDVVQVRIPWQAIMTIKKSLLRHWQLIPNFFVAYLQILVRCEIKGTVRSCVRLLCAPYCAIGNYLPHCQLPYEREL